MNDRFHRKNGKYVKQALIAAAVLHNDLTDNIIFWRQKDLLAFAPRLEAFSTRLASLLPLKGISGQGAFGKFEGEKKENAVR